MGDTKKELIRLMKWIKSINEYNQLGKTHEEIIEDCFCEYADDIGMTTSIENGFIVNGGFIPVSFLDEIEISAKSYNVSINKIPVVKVNILPNIENGLNVIPMKEEHIKRAINICKRIEKISNGEITADKRDIERMERASRFYTLSFCFMSSKYSQDQV